MWWVLYVLLALPVIILAYFELAFARKKRILDKMVGPPTIPVLGNAHQVGKNPTEILERIFEWYHQYGRENFRFWIGYYSNYFICNSKDIEFVLNSNTLITKSDIYDMLYPWLGNGLLTASGKRWHTHRKMITPSFHFNILQDFHEVMNENSNKFIKQLKKTSAGDKIFDFQNSTHYFTLDVICETAMGVTINAMEHNDAAVVKAFKEMCFIINMRAFNPFKRSAFLYRFAPDYGKFLATLKILQDFTNEVIEKRIEARRAAKPNTPGEDEFKRKKLAFLDTLLSSTKEGRPLTQHEIYEEVSTFVFEGHDTTTSGVSFAVYLLSRHPEEQRKVYEEQCAIMGNDLHRDATFQEIAEMKYLDLFIKEAQRLYPSVPFIGRYTEKDYNINGNIIPKGTTLNLGLIVLGYDDRVFKEPHRFNPERFETDKPGPFEYVPFSAGPRNCIGQKFALLEMKTIVSKIVRYFEVLPALDELISKDGFINTNIGYPRDEQLRRDKKRHKYDPIISAVITLRSNNGLHLRMRERK